MTSEGELAILGGLCYDARRYARNGSSREVRTQRGVRQWSRRSVAKLGKERLHSYMCTVLEAVQERRKAT